MNQRHLSRDERITLLEVAKHSIEIELAGLAPRPPDATACSSRLAAPGSSFVTLNRNGALRGCCGSVDSRRPLLLDVWHNARASAFGDLRFEPLPPAEWRDARIEIAVLSPLERLVVASEAELLELLQPGVDGVVLGLGDSRATFLPKVWAQLPDPREFLAELKLKGGWSVDFWASELEIYRYTTEILDESTESAAS